MFKTYNHISLSLLLLSLLCVNIQAQTGNAQNTVKSFENVPFSSYCAAEDLIAFPGIAEVFITNVDFSTLNNESDIISPLGGGYEDYTSTTPIPDVQQGTSESISVTIDPNGGLSGHVWVFIDWNHSGFFDDANEAFDLGDKNTDGDLPDPANSVNIDVPIGATTGNTRMRVVVIDNDGNGTNVQPPCDSNSDFSTNRIGEVEDYTINVIAEPEPEFFISEVADPDVPLGPGKFVEIFNAGVTELDFSIEQLYLARDSDGVDVIHYIPLVGTIPAKGYYVIGEQSNFNTTYGFEPDHNDNFDITTVSGNGNDAYFISTDATDDTSLINTIVDIYGVERVNGTGTNWEYTNSRAYRNNPTVKDANTLWDISEWTLAYPTIALPTDMTPGYGDNDYVYVDDTDAWGDIGLGDPNSTTPTDAQNIFVRSGSVSLTQDTTIGDLVVRSGATLTLAPNIKLTVSGDIVNEGTIIFDSDATGTAVLETLASSSRVVGEGFEVRRYIPVVTDFRAYRYLSSSVTTTTSINQNWQEGATTGSPNPRPGSGTHITGAVGTVGNVSAAGIDFTSSGNASMYAWDETSQTWPAITNTITNTFNVGDAYAILIRGDRSASLSSNTLAGPSTTLRTTGQIYAGDFSVTSLATAVNEFSLVGNPYQSQVNLQTLLTNNSSGLSQNFVTIWDPTIGFLGGNVTIDLTDGSIDNQSVPGTSDANQYLQPQQAFFIETTGASPSLTFTESDKINSISQTSVFNSDEDDNLSQLDLTLKASTGRTYDGLRLVYNNTYSNSIDNADAIKFWNHSNNMAVVSGGSFISIEKRSIPTPAELTPLYVYGLTLTDYSLEAYFNAQNPDFQVFLLDNYTGVSQEILPNIDFTYTFTIDASIPESFHTDRFNLVYNTTTLGAEEDGFGSNFYAYPNPAKDGFFRITTPGISDEVTLEISNSLGQVLRSDRLQVHANKVKVDVQSLSRGVYVVKLSQHNKRYTTKVIIE